MIIIYIQYCPLINRYIIISYAWHNIYFYDLISYIIMYFLVNSNLGEYLPFGYYQIFLIWGG